MKGANDQLFDSMICLVLGNAVVGGDRPCCTFLARRFHPPHTPFNHTFAVNAPATT